MLLLLVVGCRGETPPPAAPPPPSVRERAAPQAPAAPEATGEAAPVLPAEVRAEYESAKDGVRSQDYRRAQAHLEKAVELLPDFTEGWYNLGATYTRLAILAAQESGRDEALAFFNQAVDAKRKARDLMDQGRFYVYLSEAEQSQVRDDVAKALEDVDDVRADEASLLTALRIWGNVEPQ
jgi:tetratricopeptide (TPR) repeat protein